MLNAKTEFLQHVENRHIECAVIKFDDGEDEVDILLQVDYDETDLQKFLDSLNVEYNEGYGTQYVYGTIWYSDKTWSTRGEYDGSEWWEHHTLPEIPHTLYKSVDKYTVYASSGTTVYNYFTVESRIFKLEIPTDLGVGPFYTDRPDCAVPEVERYLLEQWGRKERVFVDACWMMRRDFTELDSADFE